MYRAKWNDIIIAEANDDEIFTLEGNRYFPESALKKEYFKESSNTYQCPWKGMANYFDIIIGQETNPDAAWVYRAPSDAASEICGMYGFWNGVVIEHVS
jgi:uncharacterized protein (DUF427 family)